MDNSDDYFIDDIVFDDQTLAVLDQEEQKYRTQLSPSPPRPSAKRLKTNNGWTPAGRIGSQSNDDLDVDLPEISIKDDGSYNVSGQASYPMVASQSTVHRIQTPSIFPSARTFVVDHHHRLQASQGPSSSSEGHQPPTPLHTSQPRRTVSNHVSGTIPLPQKSVIPSTTHVKDLQQKLAEMQEENLKMQAALKEALDGKVAKEGEVSILRKNIEKTSQNHTAQLAKLKAAKDESDAKQLQIEKKWKDEMERLKTQFLFKQHELESSTRKPPASARQKKLFRDPPSTPLAISSQMRVWNEGARNTAGSFVLLNETPSRRQHANGAQSSPSRRHSPEKRRKPLNLPGFHNTFDETPKRLGGRSTKGKEKAEEDDNYPLQGPSSPVFQRWPSSSPPKPLFVEDVTTSHPVISATEQMMQPLQAPAANSDAMMIDTDTDYGDTEELDLIEAINWKSELSRVVLTHRNPDTGDSIFQSLLGQSLSNTEAAGLMVKYTQCCTRVLEMLASAIDGDDSDISIKIVCESLISMASVLVTANLLTPLVSLLNLLTVLIYSQPKFGSFLMQIINGEDAIILTLLCQVIHEKLVPAKSYDREQNLVLHEIISLFESLCFGADEEVVQQLQLIPRHQVFMILLHTSQSSSVLEHTSRLLVKLATYKMLWKALLNKSEPENNSQDAAKVPYIDRLCQLMIDTSRKNFESFRTYTLVFFTLLSTADPDAHSTLVGSYTLIPSIVLFLAQITSPIWEDEWHPSSEKASAIIRTSNQILYLLYHLVFGAESTVNLRHKLQHSPHRPYNIVIHTFIVTFGRLSYADAPEWLGPRERVELESLSEIARALLELVVDGPEGDSVWGAYQIEPDQESLTDEEELEAKLTGSGT